MSSALVGHHPAYQLRALRISVSRRRSYSRMITLASSAVAFLGMVASLVSLVVGPQAVVRASYSCASGRGAAFGFGRSKSHSLLGHAITGPDFKYFSTRYSLPHFGHFSAIGLCAELNLHVG